MKKLLALVLALVMTLGLATVSSNAAAKVSDYKDADKINYEEAVAVMQATGIMVGDDQGQFNPGNQLKRSEAAKIVAYLLLGNKSADAIQGTGNKFNDVGASNWYSGYVEYLTSTGVIAGKGAGNFAPDDQLTTNEFAKMLLVALGYDAEIEGLTGTDWAINTQKIANQIDLFDGKENPVGSAAVTREEAALYAFNTLKSALVEYDSKVSVKINDADVTIGSSNAKPVTNEKLNNQTIYTDVVNATSNAFGAYITEFAEKYYSKLELSKTETMDAFGRPVNTWLYDGVEVGSYIRNDLLIKEYTTKITGLDLYTLIGRDIIENAQYNWGIYIDGEASSAIIDTVGSAARSFTVADLNKNNKKTIGGTGNGVLTQVFLDKEDKEVTIAVINTYLAEATKDYDARKDTVELEIYMLEKVTAAGVTGNRKAYTTGATDAKLSITSEDFAEAKNISDGDLYLVTVAEGEIQTLEAPKVVESAVLSQFSLDDNVITNGTSYYYGTTVEFDGVLDAYTDGNTINLKDNHYNLYLDKYGYLIGIEELDDDDNYVFITGVDVSTSNLSTQSYKANAIFTDGTMATISVNATKKDGSAILAGGTKSICDINALVNTWCTYTVNGSGVYTLTYANRQSHDTTATEIDVKHISLAGGAGRVYGNDKSIYINVNLKTIRTDYSSVAGTYPTALSATDPGATVVDTIDAAIVDKVESTVTGIKNVSYKPYTSKLDALVKSDSNTNNIGVTSGLTTVDDRLQTATGASNYAADDGAYGTYVLYNKDSYVIAAVVIGGTSWSTSNLVYTGLYDLKAESYDAATDTWTWTRDVIINGAKATLVEKSDSLEYIDTTSMTSNTWYKVFYNAKGEVVSKSLRFDDPAADIDYTKSAEDQNTPGYTGIQNMVDNEDKVLYTEQMVTDSKPVMKNSTFYRNDKDTSGFWVTPNAKVALIQKNQGKWSTEFGEGVKAVQSFIDELHGTADGFTSWRYQVSAILENGEATSVILYDMNQDNGTSTGTTTGTTTATLTGTASTSGMPIGSDRIVTVGGAKGLDTSGMSVADKKEHAAYNEATGKLTVNVDAFATAAASYTVTVNDERYIVTYENVKFDPAKDKTVIFDFIARDTDTNNEITVSIK